MSTTSSSRRKPRTTGWSRPARWLIVPALLAAALPACRARSGETLLTYFSGDHGLSLRHPAGWRTHEAERNGIWYRTFLAPASAAQSRTPLPVTVLAGPTTASLDAYAQTYLANQKIASTRTEERQGIGGRSWVFVSPDGKTRGRLLLLARGGRIVGLYAQGEADAVEKEGATLDAIWSSFTIERPDRYPVHSWKKLDASLGVPDSWRQTREFSGGGTTLVQFASPPLAVDQRQTIHAALSITLEPAPAGGLAEYYENTRRKLGDSYVVASHQAFKGGLVDVMRTETPVAVSFIKRFYFAEGGRACSLSFEAREDVFPSASRWADYIASTLRLGATAAAAETPR